MLAGSFTHSPLLSSLGKFNARSLAPALSPLTGMEEGGETKRYQGADLDIGLNFGSGGNFVNLSEK